MPIHPTHPHACVPAPGWGSRATQKVASHLPSDYGRALALILCLQQATVIPPRVRSES